VIAINKVEESLVKSAEISSYAMSKPGKPCQPDRIFSIKDGTTAKVTIGWYALIETGGVLLTSYKLY
jgi:hypothetical protein